ncbi:sulfatase family protein [Algoriphagus sediminis]|uniref:Sulfatase n=1 Tax=Algoriphagus sediminis TaxID=3057113 RepID=A0ABT7YFL7_9BACT|nr:sulfatase [Algoriphagus sediminis]MDN3205328.1 sulfatase [Algoriphagus sediminis]
MRNSFHLLLIVFILFSCEKGAQEPEETNNISYPDRPNIVWIVNEDMSPEHLGVYGGTGGKTPNIDALAAEGLRFTNAFSTAGVCAPSRAAIITGAYQTSIGAHNMRTTGMSANALEAYPPGFKSYNVVLPEDMWPYPVHLRMAGYYVTNNVKEDYQFQSPVMMWDESSREAHWRNRPDPDQPFFSIFNLTISHESQVWARADEPLLVDPDSVLVPPVYPDDSISRQTIARFITNVMQMDEQVGDIIQELKDEGLYENTIIFYYSDHGDGMPYYKRELYDRGLKIPLIVKAPFLEAGSVTDELVSFVDFGPTVLSLAGVQIPESMQGQAFLGDQKSEPRKYIYAARDRMDSEYDRVRAVSDGRFKYIRNYMPEKPNYQNIQYRLQNPLMVHLLELNENGELNENQARWFAQSKPEEELYDTQNDPWEFNNLVGNPGYAGKLEELRKAHEDWIEKYGDKGALNEMEMVRSWWNGGENPPITAPAEVSFSEGKVTLSCPTSSALIGWRKSESDTWQVYTAPFEAQAGETIYVNSHRIGYEPSEFQLTLE